MTYRIKKGKHRAWPPLLGLWYNKRVLRRVLSFDFSAKYDLVNDDQEDTNKLFGIGYLWSHHRDSARFGWRYDNNRHRFILSAYLYVAGERIIKDLCSVVAHRCYIAELQVLPGMYQFRVTDAEQPAIVYGDGTIHFSHCKKWAFPLGLYFGGNQAAPHDMIIKMKKV